jgi:5'-3' exoribonuclease 2
MKELGQVESEIFLVRHENEIALLKQPSLILPLRNVNRVDNIRVEERKFILMKGDENEVQKEGDTIRLWENGWKNRYYKRNFEVSESDVQFRRKVALAYTEGLCWIFKYYCQV